MSADPTNPDERPTDAASGYDQTEAFHRVTDVLKCKWTLAIVNAMGNDAARPSELQRTLPGLSAKVLTDRLKKLESFGLIEREVFPEVPPRVEYTLTQRGAELSRVLGDLVAFIDRWDPSEP